VNTSAAVSVTGIGPAPPTRQPATRIGFLDGFRAFAILSVLGFHYYSRFGSDPRGIYPFGDLWSGFPVFEYGFYGVHLFFAVSGFVIALTLMRCDTLAEFAVRRLARLWPAMLVCACLSYLFLQVFPMYFSPDAADFLPSLTFIDGRYFEKVFPGRTFDWIDGAYWSLFVEVRFYALAAAIYFIDRARFLRHTLLLFLALFAAYWTLLILGHAHLAASIHDVLILAYLPWFLFGIAAHCLWLGKQTWAATLVVTGFLPLVVGAVSASEWSHVTVAILVCAAFWLCHRFAVVRRFFSMRWLTAIGVSSYSLYLLHQNIGVTLTSVLSSSLQAPPIVTLGVPVLTAAIMICAARLIYRYWESPLNTLIVRSYRRAGSVAEPA
jgi:peptidoglycan/LPS O-acetylase OafA/YrhL